MDKPTDDELEVYKKILDSCVSHGSMDEVHIYEDLYQVDAQKAFEKLCEVNLGMSGMRLDLFLDDVNGGNDGIHKEKEVRLDN